MIIMIILIRRQQLGAGVRVTASFIEIYNEKVTDGIGTPDPDPRNLADRCF